MNRSDHGIIAMRIIKLLGIAGIAVLAASYVASRNERRRQDERRRHEEQIERERWESEGGASHTGPATPSAVSITAH